MTQRRSASGKKVKRKIGLAARSRRTGITHAFADKVYKSKDQEFLEIVLPGDLIVRKHIN